MQIFSSRVSALFKDFRRQFSVYSLVLISVIDQSISLRNVKHHERKREKNKFKNTEIHDCTLRERNRYVVRVRIVQKANIEVNARILPAGRPEQ